MSDHNHPHGKRQDIYSEITSQLVAEIESDPGKAALLWRGSSGPLFMPVNALTGNAYTHNEGIARLYTQPSPVETCS